VNDVQCENIKLIDEGVGLGKLWRMTLWMGAPAWGDLAESTLGFKGGLTN
jgi:hypothetical protein